MADQIKNENLGEVSSPATEEMITAPNVEEPAIVEPQNETAQSPSAEGDAPAEAKPDRKPPVLPL